MEESKIAVKLPPEPYRILFPVAIFCILFAVLLWPFFSWGWISFYPRLAHGHLMFFGGFGSFVAGFLMTAVPRMTNSRPAHALESGLMSILAILQIPLSLSNQLAAQVYLYALFLVVILFFVGARIYSTRRVPFEGFYFVPWAFFWAFYSVFQYLLSNNFQYLNIFLGEAFLLNLICGLGARLIPVVTKIPNALMPNQPSQNRKYSFIFSMLMLNLLYLIKTIDPEFNLELWLGIFLLFYSSLFFGLWKRPAQWGILSLALKSSLLIMIGIKIYLGLKNKIDLPLLHIFYIAGLYLLTISIATRVILAHGNKDLNYEIRGTIIGVVTSSLVIASILRWLAGGDIQGGVLFLAVGVFMLGNIAWLKKFIETLL